MVASDEVQLQQWDARLTVVILVDKGHSERELGPPGTVYDSSIISGACAVARCGGGGRTVDVVKGGFGT